MSLYLLLRSEPTPSLLLPHPPPPTTLLQILLKLKTHPLQSLRPSEKVSICSVLIEDLLGSPALCREVDTKMEQISTLRRGKWKINLKLKRYWGVGGERVWVVSGVCSEVCVVRGVVSEGCE